MVLNHTLAPPRDIGSPCSVLDVGCGIRPQLLATRGVERYLGIDVYQPYVDAMEDPEHFRCSHWKPALAEFADNEFDLLTALDFIEHLKRDEGLEFVAEAQRVGRLVVIFTPLGPFPQKFASPDQWGMHGGRPQMHRSAWTPDDFDGWEIHIAPGFHVVDGQMNPLSEPHDAFWALEDSNLEDMAVMEAALKEHEQKAA